MKKRYTPKGLARREARRLLRHEMFDFTPGWTFIIVLMILGTLIVFLSTILGCGTASPQALDHTDALLNAATNTIEGLKTYFAPLVPAPFTGIATGLLTVVSAGLVAWNAHQHSQIKTLQNGHSLATHVPAP